MLLTRHNELLCCSVDLGAALLHSATRVGSNVHEEVVAFCCLYPPVVNDVTEKERCSTLFWGMFLQVRCVIDTFYGEGGSVGHTLV